MNQLTNQQFFPDNEQKYLIFTLSDKKYAISVSHVLEVFNLPELVVPQKLPILICGLLKYNNLIINVINTYKVFDLEEKPFGADNQLILIKTEDTIWGMVVDNVEDLVTISNDNINPKTYSAQNSIIKFISFINEEMIFMIDCNSLEKYIKEKEEVFSESSEHQNFCDDEASKEIFANRKLALQNKKTYISPQMYIETTDYIWFQIESENYCLRIDFVLEIINNIDKITPLPNTPEFISGVIFHHGYFYTIIDLSRFFGNVTSSESKKKNVIIVNDSNFKIAFVVDNIMGIKKFSNDDLINSENKKTKSKFCSHEIVTDNKLFYILDLKHILLDNRLLIFDILKA